MPSPRLRLFAAQASSMPAAGWRSDKRLKQQGGAAEHQMAKVSLPQLLRSEATPVISGH
jgi:hypothetical protein